MKTPFIFLIRLFIVLLLFFVTFFLFQKRTEIFFASRGVLYLCVMGSIIVVSIFMGSTLLLYVQMYRPRKKLEQAVNKLCSLYPDRSRHSIPEIEDVADMLEQLLYDYKTLSDRVHDSWIMNQQYRFAELQSQINPHFLYNTLESIRGQALCDGNERIAEMTELLAKYFRYNISCDADIVSLEDELTSVQNYVKIQQYRFEDRFDFQIIRHGDTEDFLSCTLPKMTLQPIVENAIFHGLETKAEFGHIVIHLERTMDHLIIIVQDDGIGIAQDTLDQLNMRLRNISAVTAVQQDGHNNGVAMINSNLRIKLLFGPEYGISMTSTVGVGTEVEILLPVSGAPVYGHLEKSVL